MDRFRNIVESARAAHHRAVESFLAAHTADLETLVSWCHLALAGDGRLLLFGNGGSAADAQHVAAEFVNRFDRPRAPLAALALTTDSSILTSVANDDAFEQVFARQVAALGRSGDVALALSTSGRSRNIVLGLREARRRGIRTALLGGGDGGDAAREADLALLVPVGDTARIQEVHLLAGHLVCAGVEQALGTSSNG